MKITKEYPLAYAAYNKDIYIRQESTSGGIFTVLADYFINEHKASVYGAGFDEYFNVTHMCINSVEELFRLRGSKYPQSSLSEVFKEIKEKLNNNRFVFFTGTPCQVSGLKSFLIKDYNNLFTMDFVCHGVASRMIWRDYVNTLSENKEINNIIFKSKLRGWRRWFFRVEYVDNTNYQIRGSMNLFMRSFLTYTNVRPSCYECKFKGLKRVSDFSVADCWGVGESNKRLNDDKGLSALLIQNERAEAIFEKIKFQIEYEEYSAHLLMKENWTTLLSIPRSELRKSFFDDVKCLGSINSLKSYFSPSLLGWIKYYWRRVKGVEK